MHAGSAVLVFEGDGGGVDDSPRLRPLAPRCSLQQGLGPGVEERKLLTYGIEVLPSLRKDDDFRVVSCSFYENVIEIQSFS